MREEFGWQHKKTHRAPDWSAPPEAPRAIRPWRHLPLVVAVATLFGLAAGVGLIDHDRRQLDRLLIGAGLANGERG